ncbi:DM13 domain-containing protein [Aestuariibaculum sediminum]|uniref:DM13 domain-containing protein n=1 Tax=Aestuariibaculum sediminum TaxID=2770637 RepID=A0A8J6QH64_9FLAO|nr:DM13 domain-containing protein [Aestuariibaculum sediminum]MBD0831699.1 DM13 domain-containing protein [Aestuariibaculum sediminum]
MKLFYLLALTTLLFSSCSSSDDTTEMSEENMEMEEMTSDEAAYTGDFVSSAHETSGMASIDKDKKTLALTNFKTDEGPNLEVYLATNTSASTYITLGAIKGVNGNYSYDLPENINFETYNHVIIWCVPFSVNFGYAVLK